MKYKSKEMRKIIAPNMKKRYFSKFYKKQECQKIIWALSLKPNEDVFHACDGFNHVLKSVYCYRNEFGNMGFVELNGTDGHIGDLHHCVEQYTPTQKEIEDYYKLWLSEEHCDRFRSYWPTEYTKYSYAFENGLHICDEKGIKINIEVPDVL